MNEYAFDPSEKDEQEPEELPPWNVEPPEVM